MRTTHVFTNNKTGLVGEKKEEKQSKFLGFWVREGTNLPTDKIQRKRKEE